MVQKKKKKQKKQQIASKMRGIRYGYRSGLEEKIAKQIADAGHKVIYEQEKIGYVVPSRNAKYCLISSYLRKMVSFI